MNEVFGVAEVDGENYVNRVDLIDFLQELSDKVAEKESHKMIFNTMSQGVTRIGEPSDDCTLGTLNLDGSPPIKFFNTEKFGVFLHYEDLMAMLKSAGFRFDIEGFDTKDFKDAVKCMEEGLKMLIDRAIKEMDEME